MKVGLAEYFADKGQQAEAFETASEAAALSPQNLRAQILASETARRVGDLAVSYDHAMKAMSIDPGSDPLSAAMKAAKYYVGEV